jgi:hypothetical protein
VSKKFFLGSDDSIDSRSFVDLAESVAQVLKPFARFGRRIILVIPPSDKICESGHSTGSRSTGVSPVSWQGNSMPTGETPEVLESTNPRARWYNHREMKGVLANGFLISERDASCHTSEVRCDQRSSKTSGTPCCRLPIHIAGMPVPLGRPRNTGQSRRPVIRTEVSFDYLGLLTGQELREGLGTKAKPIPQASEALPAG